MDDLEPRALLSTASMSLSAHTTFQARPFAGGGGPSAPYTPTELQEAYGFSSITFNGVAGTGSGETIAIVDAYDDPNIQTDLNTFDTQFGLPAMTVTRVSETGTTSYPTSDSTGGWELEESLDVEWAHAMAPGANILLVEASSPSYSDLLAAVNYAAAHANVVSMSWAGGEFSGETSYDGNFDQAGVAFVASSGDSGAPASYPAVSPNVLSVGGTALTIGANNVWSSEVGWSGSGGGPSLYESQPSYQKGVVTQTSSARAAPDVAYDGDPSTGFAVYDSVPYAETTYDWLEVGGTSAGSPQWSALLAIADQGRAASGQPPLDSTSPQQVMSILYENPSDFHDITSGTSLGTPNYSAGPGYDYVT
ncbi:MAG TPA: S53 family peptidase, partial [Isosphaeraceae bacterium]|nr:S53 family peptidase [Isosphaeraceae bacterium]